MLLNGKGGPSAFDPRVTSNSLWDIASEKFVAEAKGNFRIIAPGALDEASVFVKSELPALLSNTNIGEIDGVPRSALAELGQDAAKKAINFNSAQQVHFGQLSAGNIGTWLSGDKAALDAAFADKALQTGWMEKLKSGVLGAADDSSVVRNLKDIATKFPNLSGWGKALGPLAVGASLILASLNANAEYANGNAARAKEIMTEWAVDAAGSQLLQVAAGFVVGLGAAAAVAAGVVTAPVAGAIVLGAALVGGFFGGDVAVDFYHLLDDRDGNGKRDIFDKLSNLLFGATSTITTPLPADLNGDTFTIDASLTRDEMVANAKTSIAWRYALRELNSFVISDVSYTAHNTDGSLDLYDKDSNPGGLTDEYLVDRAAMLAWKLQFEKNGARDDDDAVRTGSKPYNEEWDTNAIQGNWDFMDLTTKLAGGSPLKLVIDGAGLSQYDHQVVFGSKDADTIEGSGDSDRLYGMGGKDTLSGGAESDYIEGGKGDDTLAGGVGNDTLLGGTGNDTYNTNTGDGIDTILDADGQGSIVHNGIALTTGQYTAPNQWKDAQGNTFTLLDTGAGKQDLLIDAGTEQIIVKNYSTDQLGIQLAGEVAPSAFTQSGNGISVVGDRMAYQMPWSTWAWTNNPTWPYLFDSNGNMVRTGVPQPYYADKIFDTAGDDSLYAGDGLNVIFATKGGNNHIQTGANDDYITGGAGRDRIYAGGMTDTVDAGGGDDIVYGEDGGDVIESGAGKDYISGGAGADAINGGAGDDLLFAGDSITLAHALTDSGVAATGQGELMAGGDGNDIAVGSATDDALLGGVGDDTLAGREGDDIVLGDSGLVFVAPPLSKFDAIIGAARWPMGPYLGIHSPFTTAPMLGIEFQRIDHGVGSANRYEVKLSSASNPEAPRDNWMTPPTEGGRDQLYGGSGDDWLLGEWGDDVLDGGAGADVLIGGVGNDMLLGGAGNDQYVLSPGDGADTLVDALGSDTLYLANLSRADLSGVRDGDSMILKTRDTTDTITLSNWFVQSEGVSHIAFGDGSSLDHAGIEALLNHAPVAATPIASQVANEGSPFSFALAANTFTDADVGDTLSYTATLADGSTLPSWLQFNAASHTFSGTPGAGDMGSISIQVTATDGAGASANSAFGISVAAPDPLAGNDTLTADANNTPLHGGAGNDTLSGSWASSTLYGDAGDDVITATGGPSNVLDGGEGNDVLTGGWGQDTLRGGAGNNAILATGGNSVISAGAGNDRITSGWGDDQIDAGDGNNSIAAGGGHNRVSAGSGVDVISTGWGNDTISAGAGDDAIAAGGGANTVRAGQGSDQITNDQWSDDSYFFARGDARALVPVSGAPEQTLEVDGHDVLLDIGGQDRLTLEGVQSDQLWFSQMGNDLDVSIIGTHDHITLQNWYLGDQYHIEQFKTSDGRVLLDSQVQALVQAMAAFSPPAPGQTTLAADYAAALNPVLAANWH